MPSSQNEISLSIFFPAYNEEKNIIKSIEAALIVARSITKTYEVIVVNDGSRDATATLVQECAHKDPHVRLIDHEKNKGYGDALKSGLAHSKYDFIFFTDADLQFDLSELKNFCEYATKYDVIIGYRKNRQDHWMRLVNAKLWNIANRVLFGLKVRDIDCAFKLMRKEYLQKISLSAGGAMISAEMLLKLQETGARIIELPVTHYKRIEGSPTGANPKVILRAGKEMWRLYSVEMGEKTQIQFLKFAIIGTINTTFGLIVYILLTRVVSLKYLAAEIITYSLGTMLSFLLNKRWTFQEYWQTNLAEFKRYLGTTASAIAINACAFTLLLHFGLFDIASVLVAAVFTIAWNFLLSKYWVFQKTELDS